MPSEPATATAADRHPVPRHRPGPAVGGRLVGDLHARHGEGPPDGAADRPGPRHLHGRAAVLLAATSAIERFGSQTPGLAARPALLTVLVAAAPKAPRAANRPNLADGSPWQAWAIAALVLVALVFRILVVHDSTLMITWLVAASLAFAGA